MINESKKEEKTLPYNLDGVQEALSKRFNK